MISSSPPGSVKPPVRYKRSVRNYIIDWRFQLKYTSLIVLVTIVVSGMLVFALARTSSEVLRQGEQVKVQGQRALVESRKVSEVVRMSMKDDAVYSQSPELLAAFNANAAEADKKLDEQQRALDGQQRLLEAQQRTMFVTLIALLTGMVAFFFCLGIYFTHKVAGPIYKMKMLLRQVAEGKLSFRGSLRKGDELQDFFEAFATMVEALRQRQAKEVEELEAALKLARQAGASDASIAKIELVRDEMRRALDA